MRMHFGAAVLLLGCGGQVDDAAASEGAEASTGAASCAAYGDPPRALGTVPGTTWALAAAGANVFAVSSATDAAFVTNTQGTLYRLGNGSFSAVTDDTVDPSSLTPLGDTLGLLRVAHAPNGTPYDDRVETFAADGTETTLDSATTGALGALTTDGNTLAWYRWSFGDSGNLLPIPAIASGSDPSSVVETQIDSSIFGVGRFVTDGSAFYAAFDPVGDGTVALGRLATRTTSARVLVDASDHPFAPIAVDARNLYFYAYPTTTTEELRSVPKLGGTAITLASGSFLDHLVVRNGSAYWLDHEPTQTNVMQVPLDGTSSGSEVAVIGAPVYALAASPCGLLIAVANATGDAATVEELTL